MSLVDSQTPKITSLAYSMELSLTYYNITQWMTVLWFYWLNTSHYTWVIPLKGIHLGLPVATLWRYGASSTSLLLYILNMTSHDNYLFYFFGETMYLLFLSFVSMMWMMLSFDSTHTSHSFIPHIGLWSLSVHSNHIISTSQTSQISGDIHSSSVVMCGVLGQLHFNLFLFQILQSKELQYF